MLIWCLQKKISIKLKCFWSGALKNWILSRESTQGDLALKDVFRHAFVQLISELDIADRNLLVESSLAYEGCKSGRSNTLQRKNWNSYNASSYNHHSIRTYCSAVETKKIISIFFCVYFKEKNELYTAMDIDFLISRRVIYQSAQNVLQAFSKLYLQYNQAPRYCMELKLPYSMKPFSTIWSLLLQKRSFFTGKKRPAFLYWSFWLRPAWYTASEETPLGCAAKDFVKIAVWVHASPEFAYISNQIILYHLIFVF